jgi:site-specific recombinase XerD
MKLLCSAFGVLACKKVESARGAHYMINIIDLKTFEKHLSTVKGLKPSSIRRYSAEVAAFFKWGAENGWDGCVEEMRRERIEGYLKSCLNRGNGTQTLRNKLVAVQNFSDFLVYSHIITNDPTAGIDRPEPKNDLTASFSREDVLRLFRECDLTTEIGLRNATLLALAAFAGLGSGEISRLCVEHVKVDGKNVEIIVVKVNGENRTIRLWEAPSILIQKFLTARLGRGARKGEAFLTSHRGKRLAASDLDHLIKDLSARAKMRRPQITITMLRHAHITSLRSVQGYDPAKIAARMGWRSLHPIGRHLFWQKKINPKYLSLEGYWFEFTKWIRNSHRAG